MTEKEGDALADSLSSDEIRMVLSFVREWDIGSYEDCHALLSFSLGSNEINGGVRRCN